MTPMTWDWTKWVRSERIGCCLLRRDNNRFVHSEDISDHLNLIWQRLNTILLWNDTELAEWLENGLNEVGVNESGAVSTKETTLDSFIQISFPAIFMSFMAHSKQTLLDENDTAKAEWLRNEWNDSRLTDISVSIFFFRSKTTFIPPRSVIPLPFRDARNVEEWKIQWWDSISVSVHSSWHHSDQFFNSRMMEEWRNEGEMGSFFRSKANPLILKSISFNHYSVTWH